MNSIRGVDCSYDELTEAKAQALLAQGITVITQCLWTGSEQPSNRVTNLRNASASGLHILGYASITPSNADLTNARGGVPDDLWAQMIRVFVDVELQGLTVGQVGGALNQVLAWGKPRDVYTNLNTWQNWLGNPSGQNCGLWYASWGDSAGPNIVTPTWGVRWREIIGKQYQGSTVLPLAEAPLLQAPEPGRVRRRLLDGSGYHYAPVTLQLGDAGTLTVDLDTFDADVLGIAPAPPVPTPGPVTKVHEVDIYSDGSVKVT